MIARSSVKEGAPYTSQTKPAQLAASPAHLVDKVLPENPIRQSRNGILKTQFVTSAATFLPRPPVDFRIVAWNMLIDIFSSLVRTSGFGANARLRCILRNEQRMVPTFAHTSVKTGLDACLILSEAFRGCLYTKL